MSANRVAIDAITEYVQQVASLATNTIAREHSYRPALVRMFNQVATDVETFNDPARSSEGQPDFVFVQKNNSEIVRGYGEAKDLGANLDRAQQTEQLIRYAGYDQLLLTNELEFRFYRDGLPYAVVHVARMSSNGIVEAMPQNFNKFIDELHAFLDQPPAKITSATKLAKSMGGKARRVRDFVLASLNDPAITDDDDILKMFKVVQNKLVSRMDHDEFADMYAQTLIYGLFSARYSDKSEATFTRQEARDLIPASTHFLRTFFDHVAGPGFSRGLAQIAQEMCEILSLCDVDKIVHRRLAEGDDADGRDPIIHFYEDFLKEYDSDQRKKRGAYYTPTPVVRFIIRAVDSALKDNFGIAEGLADSSKHSISVPTQPGLERKTGNIRRTRTTAATVDVHRVQILDFATGTATFLNEVIKHVHKSFKGQEGLWPSYAADELVPRLNGFELMMAPYAIAHMKLGMTLGDLGATDANRFRVFLTNTLERPMGVEADLFQFGLLEALTEESAAAGEVKDRNPIMVVIGNPPYSGVSANNFAYANNFSNKYKVEPGGKTKLQETNTKWLNNDYVKFIGFAEELITKNGNGIVAVITDNSYLMSPTFRGMRWHLANTFDRLMVLDLHGRKIPGDKPDSMQDDQNVFDIMQGVSVLIAVKDGTKVTGELAEVRHAEMMGNRRSKFDRLEADDIQWEELTLDEQFVYFKPTGVDACSNYKSGVSVTDLFNVNSVGIAAGRDSLAIARSKNELTSRLQTFVQLDAEAARKKFGLRKDARDWQVKAAQKDVGVVDPGKIIPLTYRPFDQRWTYYTGTSKGFHCYPRQAVSEQFINHDNLALCFTRRIEQDRPFADVLVTENVIQFHSLSIKESNYIAPLYVWDSTGVRHPNLKPQALRTVSKNLTSTPTARELLAYVYGVLSDPLYRSENDASLRLDYPRVPIPENDHFFETYREYGDNLIRLHTMKSSHLDQIEITYPIAGSNFVSRFIYRDGKIWINEKQYFGNVSQTAWEFVVGSYTPALKWLKDRSGTALALPELRHYQKLIKVAQLSVEAMELFSSPLSVRIPPQADPTVT